MRTVGQHVRKSNVLSTRISSLALRWKRVALYATIGLGFFLLGFLPMWFKSSRAVEQRDAAQRGVRLAQLQNTLAAAVIDVQQGEYEPARQLTSDFYTNLRRLITLLARSDREATDAEKKRTSARLVHSQPP